MPTFHIHLPAPEKARGAEPSLSFTSVGAAGFAEELQAALRGDSMFQRWRQAQDDPDAVDPKLGATDAGARVSGTQKEDRVELAASTLLPGEVLKHRLALLAGNNWELRDVSFDR